MIVKIYIETVFAGRFECGKGKCACVLEVDWNGQPVSRTHYGAWKDITIQRLHLRACIIAMKHITKESDIQIYINAPALALEFEKRIQGVKGPNEDLWRELRRLCNPHFVTVTHQKRTICTPALQSKLKHKVLLEQPDKEYIQGRIL